MEDDTDFIKQLKQLKSDLSSRINKIQKILSTSSMKLQRIEDLLESYRQHPILHKNRAEAIKKTSHDIEIQTGYAFQLMPGGYFNSLKFLRHYWYDFEASLIEI